MLSWLEKSADQRGVRFDFIMIKVVNAAYKTKVGSKKMDCVKADRKSCVVTNNLCQQKCLEKRILYQTQIIG